MTEPSEPLAFWSHPAAEVLSVLGATPAGLTAQDARERLTRYGPNRLAAHRQFSGFALFLAQFKSPIVLLLAASAVLSALLGQTVDAGIILSILIVSSLLQFWQERSAADATKKLLVRIQTKATVLRDGAAVTIPLTEVVPGDIVLLAGGGSVPGDCLILESDDLSVDEATLTGETFPAAKMPSVLAADTSLGQRTNCVFMGTHVVSGSATAVVVRTGTATEFGQVSQRLRLRPPETAFAAGVQRFGYLLTEFTLLLTVAIFGLNVYARRPVIDSILFALALAVGLTPQLLPAIVSITLARGAKRMAARKVIVKRLEAIEDFGSMNVLCADKTGTLTEGTVRVQSALDAQGAESRKVALYGYLNAALQAGYTNPIDEAIRSTAAFDLSGYRKLDEIPYDFVRKRLSVLVAAGTSNLLITKGALEPTLAVCDFAESGGVAVALQELRAQIVARHEGFGRQGLRTLGVAYREMGDRAHATRDDESGMTFLGFLVLFDPLKSGIVETLTSLKALGVSLKLITGDNRLVAQHVAGQVGLLDAQILTGAALHRMSPEALLQRAKDVAVFAEVEPNQKERIIGALRKAGHVVGYLGDGINDASALHAANVGISVDTAVDVAREAADFVLLEKDLHVLLGGIQEGRRTFANTLKYVMITASANLGNMLSMAAVSVFLPFLPMLPKQILLTNVLSDIPAMAIADDSVDAELVATPRRWNVEFIRNFMLVFGVQSSLFDFLTFGALLFLMRAGEVAFHTGWFLESVISEVFILQVIRTRRFFVKSRPGPALEAAAWAVIGVTLVLPYTPLGGFLGFVPLPAAFLFLLAGILASYVGTAEITKAVFYRKVRQ